VPSVRQYVSNCPKHGKLWKILSLFYILYVVISLHICYVWVWHVIFKNMNQFYSSFKAQCPRKYLDLTKMKQTVNNFRNEQLCDFYRSPVTVQTRLQCAVNVYLNVRREENILSCAGKLLLKLHLVYRE